MRLIPTLVVALLATACERQATEELAAAYQPVPVEVRDIVISVEAAGTVEPVTTVEVKSKASGEILELPIEIGDVVEKGTLLVRIDKRVLSNTLRQAEASLEVARARLSNAESQLKRIDALYKQNSVSQSEWESATLEQAVAKSDVVRSEIAVENARIEIGDSDVMAPITGRVIERLVERGQVISSPTKDVGGGTLLLKMADLSRVQVRMLVDETDIGKIRPGVAANVKVAAFPNTPFEGKVTKIEPQAVTEQNVTMFPVLIDIENRSGHLKPGMNADVEVDIARREGVLAIPNAALRTPGDVYSAGEVLGISAEEIRAMLAEARPSGDATESQSAMGAESGPSVEERERMDRIRAKFGAGERPSAEERTFMRALRERYPDAFAGSSGPGFGGRVEGGSQLAVRARSSLDSQFGGRYIVFVMRGGKPTAVPIRAGITDLDYTEVVEGLGPEDSVLILPSASLVEAQQRFQNRISSRMALPGMTRNNSQR
jgi:HlyD family secretion protein